MSLDLDKLSPSDAAAALRSYPRRYRAAMQPVRDDDDVDELAHRAGPDGRSAVQIASDVTRTWVVLRQGLRQITVTDTPVLHPAVIDAGQRHWETPPPATLDETLDLLTDEATALADDVDAVGTSAWSRSGTVPGGEAITALDVVREAVAVGREGLDAFEKAMTHARR